MAKSTCSTADCSRERHGLMEICHPCYRRAYYVANRERMNAQSRVYQAANSDRLKAQRAASYIENRESVNAKNKAHRLANLDKERAAHKRWYAENREHVIAKSTAANRANPAQNAAAVAKWRKAHPSEYREFTRRRHARKMGAYVTKAEYAAVLAEFGMVCHLCGQSIPSLDSLDFDHVIPLARGGAHATGNIKPSHSSCNRSKGAKLHL